MGLQKFGPETFLDAEGVAGGLSGSGVTGLVSSIADSAASLAGARPGASPRFQMLAPDEGSTPISRRNSNGMKPG